MAKKGPPPKEFAQGESVVATDAMPGIPEGTTGKVVFAEGFSWIRYWVRFDNGVVRGSINRAKLARPAEWVDLQARRARGETADDTTADVGAAAGDAADADAGGGESKTVNGVTVPAFLLERSMKRREALGLG
jgi:hypothetical protein